MMILNIYTKSGNCIVIDAVCDWNLDEYSLVINQNKKLSSKYLAFDNILPNNIEAIVVENE